MLKFVLSLIFIGVIFLNTHAQQSQVALSTYIDVAKVYEKVVEDGYESIQIYQKLATTHYNRGNYIEAKKWFEKWFSKDKNPDKIAYLNYSKTLEALNEIEKAKHYLSLYEKKSK